MPGSFVTATLKRTIVRFEMLYCIGRVIKGNGRFFCKRCDGWQGQRPGFGHRGLTALRVAGSGGTRPRAGARFWTPPSRFSPSAASRRLACTRSVARPKSDRAPSTGVTNTKALCAGPCYTKTSSISWKSAGPAGEDNGSVLEQLEYLLAGLARFQRRERLASGRYSGRRRRSAAFRALSKPLLPVAPGDGRDVAGTRRRARGDPEPPTWSTSPTPSSPR